MANFLDKLDIWMVNYEYILSIFVYLVLFCVVIDEIRRRKRKDYHDETKIMR